MQEYEYPVNMLMVPCVSLSDFDEIVADIVKMNNYITGNFESIDHYFNILASHCYYYSMRCDRVISAIKIVMRNKGIVSNEIKSSIFSVIDPMNAPSDADVYKGVKQQPGAIQILAIENINSAHDKQDQALRICVQHYMKFIYYCIILNLFVGEKYKHITCRDPYYDEYLQIIYNSNCDDVIKYMKVLIDSLVEECTSGLTFS